MKINGLGQPRIYKESHLPVPRLAKVSKVRTDLGSFVNKIMNFYTGLSILLLAATALACSGHFHDDEDWTPEDLAELEAKWGQNVGDRTPSVFNIISN